MHFWKRLLPLALTVGAVIAASAALVLTRGFATQNIIDAAAVAVVVAALIGLYVLRRHAREVLVYDGDTATSPGQPWRAPISGRDAVERSRQVDAHSVTGRQGRAVLLDSAARIVKNPEAQALSQVPEPPQLAVPRLSHGVVERGRHGHIRYQVR
jgi:hypothetical protein